MKLNAATRLQGSLVTAAVPKEIKDLALKNKINLDRNGFWYAQNDKQEDSIYSFIEDLENLGYKRVSPKAAGFDETSEYAFAYSRGGHSLLVHLRWGRQGRPALWASSKIMPKFKLTVFNAKAPEDSDFRNWESEREDVSEAAALNRLMFSYAVAYRAFLGDDTPPPVIIDDLKKADRRTRGKVLKMTQIRAAVQAADEAQAAFISFDMTLFIRLMEIAREEIKTDAELHYLVERCSERYVEKGAPLTMDDYQAVVKAKVQLNAALRLNLKGC